MPQWQHHFLIHSREPAPHRACLEGQRCCGGSGRTHYPATTQIPFFLNTTPLLFLLPLPSPILSEGEDSCQECHSEDSISWYMLENQLHPEHLVRTPSQLWRPRAASGHSAVLDAQQPPKTPSTEYHSHSVSSTPPPTYPFCWARLLQGLAQWRYHLLINLKEPVVLRVFSPSTGVWRGLETQLRPLAA